MKFVVSSTDLLSHLQTVGRVISSKNTIPVLDEFLYSLNEKDVSGQVTEEEASESGKKFTFDEAFQASLEYFRKPSVYIPIPEDAGSIFWYLWILSFPEDGMFRSDHRLFNRYFAPYIKYQIPNEPLHQRRNRRDRYRTGFEQLREGGEIRQRYDAHSELFRDRHRRRITRAIHIEANRAGDISLTGQSLRALSLLSNLNSEA